MPNPFASSIFFWPSSNIFDLVQHFLNVFKYFWPYSNMSIYKVKSCFWPWSKNLTVFKTYWTCSKKFERGKNNFWTSRCNKIWTITKMLQILIQGQKVTKSEQFTVIPIGRCCPSNNTILANPYKSLLVIQ